MQKSIHFQSIHVHISLHQLGHTLQGTIILLYAVSVVNYVGEYKALWKWGANRIKQQWCPALTLYKVGM